MKKNTSILIVFTAALIMLAGCKEKYNLPSTVVDKNYLVVEGFINNGNDLTTIRLSRTVPTGDTANIKPEPNATLHISGEGGEDYSLQETEPGVYTGGPFALNGATKYQLHISTNNGKQYESTPMTVKYTPAVDSVSWVQDAEGVKIYANTHDPSNQTRYYAWQFEETWEFYSSTTSSFKFNPTDSSMETRGSGIDSIYRCWQSNVSTSIIIGSSAKLSDDIIYLAPLTSIEKDSWKLSSRYSILLKQRALDKETFEYLEKMKKNSEQLGTIFDPLPSTSGGNIKCITDPSEIVIGQSYISSMVEKRIFITRSQLEDWRYILYCETDTVPNIKDSLVAFFGSGQLYAIHAIYPPMGGPILGYSGSLRHCMDCTLRGIHKRPDFW